jgi:hypothetical protein
MAEQSTERDSALTCLISGIGILISCGGMFVYPCRALTYSIDFFACLYMVAMIVNVILSLVRKADANHD